jgi:hypothetical protein
MRRQGISSYQPSCSSSFAVAAAAAVAATAAACSSASDVAGATVRSYLISRALKYNMLSTLANLFLVLLLPLLLFMCMQVTWQVPRWAATSSAAHSSTTCRSA